MPTERLLPLLSQTLASLENENRLKGAETILAGEVAAANGKGPRYLIEGEGAKHFLRMNSNGYLGLAGHEVLKQAEDAAVERYGSGPGAVRFISGTWSPHVALEKRLAQFHGREDAILFSSAYATVLGVLPALVTDRTAIISDALNHNCIINAIALSRPKQKHIYRHLDFADLETKLDAASQACDRAIIVTDGVFSMRGDHASLGTVMDIARKHDANFAENVVVVADDSHGVGAFGATGRGTEEAGGGAPVDVLVGTLGKAFGVNGGYMTGAAALVRYARETAATYIYSNPITAAEAAAALAAVDLVDSAQGRERLERLRTVTRRFRDGLQKLGLETVPGEHPVVPLIVRDSARTSALVRHLRANGILATAIVYPVVPRGEEEIRFQICASHTGADIDEALAALAAFG
ncbi:MAG: aminotransferase class I/II-fold pyridoxal phosphate-dependent enzyme [Beijerinckiaceae bacterium]